MSLFLQPCLPSSSSHLQTSTGVQSPRATAVLRHGSDGDNKSWAVLAREGVGQRWLWTACLGNGGGMRHGPLPHHQERQARDQRRLWSQLPV